MQTRLLWHGWSIAERHRPPGSHADTMGEPTKPTRESAGRHQIVNVNKDDFLALHLVQPVRYTSESVNGEGGDNALRFGPRVR